MGLVIVGRRRKQQKRGEAQKEEFVRGRVSVPSHLVWRHCSTMDKWFEAGRAHLRPEGANNGKPDAGYWALTAQSRGDDQPCAQSDERPSPIYWENGELEVENLREAKL